MKARVASSCAACELRCKSENLRQSDLLARLVSLMAAGLKVRLCSISWSENKPRGVPRVNDRRVLNGVFWVLR